MKYLAPAEDCEGAFGTNSVEDSDEGPLFLEPACCSRKSGMSRLTIYCFQLLLLPSEVNASPARRPDDGQMPGFWYARRLRFLLP